MLGLTPLGTIHTAISLVALIAGLAAFFRDKGINPANTLGQVYIWATVLTCLTGFGIFERGGFGKPHALGLMTLLVLGLAWLAARGSLFGARAAAVMTVSYSLTFFFHMIPAMTETAVRLPVGSPLAASPEAEWLKMAAGILFLVFLIGATLQVRPLRK
ncbi:hypothetical protein ASC94_25520 [Massilia sp. Root418]|jgi:uncharacterized membrane protein|uniref:hypothetical protein n=1 Tax=Massilia sp. Root418 TaxID=1736532 RepID=UPI0006FE1885|nr:hypothetical protein [Massilia sp. Root418]KQW87858.1 hypothetical protein ASC94_25520 [Massilia sp. Root418]